MITIGKRTKIEGITIIGEGDIIIGDDCKFGKDITINVKKRFVLGDRSILSDRFEITGFDIEIGKEFWCGRYCAIGGGSCMDKLSKLRIGYWGHLGDFGFINTARPVIIGNEVGLGQDTRIYTHGAYQSALRGFPVEFGSIAIGDNCWLPRAVVMPKVKIGHDTVVGAGAIVTKSLPSGCLAVGIPAKVIKENCYPKPLSKAKTLLFIKNFVKYFEQDILYPKEVNQARIYQVGNRIFVEDTLFDIGDLRIDGKATLITEKFKNELRRQGIRFKYYSDNGMYKQW